jgi:dTDP-4-dehydrorhamnose reductase
MPELTGARIFVTGAGGQLGSAILSAFGDAQVTAHVRASLDITDAAAVMRAVADARPDVIINCAAFNDVDGAEDRALDALAINAFAVRHLAAAAAVNNSTLVHYSTDFVFGGDATAPYVEDDTPAPKSTYAASKLLGEWLALAAPRAHVLRVESLFGTLRGWTGRRGSLEAIVDGLEQGREVRVFADRVVSPSYIADIAAATRHLIVSDARGGVYHCVNTGSATWHEVALETARLLGVTPRLITMTLDQVSLRAPRPRYCALDNNKLAAAGFPMPTWQDAIGRWLAARGPRPS